MFHAFLVVLVTHGFLCAFLGTFSAFYSPFTHLCLLFLFFLFLLSYLPYCSFSSNERGRSTAANHVIRRLRYNWFLMQISFPQTIVPTPIIHSTDHHTLFALLDHALSFELFLTSILMVVTRSGKSTTGRMLQLHKRLLADNSTLADNHDVQLLPKQPLPRAQPVHVDVVLRRWWWRRQSDLLGTAKARRLFLLPTLMTERTHYLIFVCVTLCLSTMVHKKQRIPPDLGGRTQSCLSQN